MPSARDGTNAALSCAKNGGPMQVFAIRHSTFYRYRQPVALGEHRMMLRPRDSTEQRVLDASLEINPSPANLRLAEDVFGNQVTVADFIGRAAELRFESFARVVRWFAAERGEPHAHARFAPFNYGAEEGPDLARAIERHYADPDHEVDRWARNFLHPGARAPTCELLAAMTRAIRSDFAYASRHEQGIQNPAQTLRLRSGTCRDFALLMMEAVRSLGMAARFASGYLHVTGRGHHVDGGHTHAWAQVYLPGVGWADFDPTTGSIDNRDLILVAAAREPRQAVPLSGTFTGFPSDSLGMTVAVSVVAEEAPDAEESEAARATPLLRSRA